MGAQIGERYARGELMTGDVKARLIEVLVPVIEEHQRRRKLATDDVVKHFMSVRELEF